MRRRNVLWRREFCNKNNRLFLSVFLVCSQHHFLTITISLRLSLVTCILRFALLNVCIFLATHQLVLFPLFGFLAFDLFFCFCFILASVFVFVSVLEFLAYELFPYFDSSLSISQLSSPQFFPLASVLSVCIFLSLLDF